MYGCMLFKKKMWQKESGRQGAMAGAFEARDESRCRSGRKRCQSLGEEGFTQSMTLANTSKIQADLSTLNTAVGLYRAEKGVDPKTLDQLKEYVVNLDALKPPSGNSFLRDETEAQQAGASYALKEVNGELQATLDAHPLQAFGRAEKKEASGT